MRRLFLVFCLGLTSMTFVACGTKGPLPTIQTMCLTLPNETSEESAFVRRRAAEYAKEYGFSLSDTDCDVRVKYSRFGGFQAEQVSGFFRSGYWSQEGMLTLTRLDKPILEDQPVNLRGYSSKRDLLDGLAWELVKPVTKSFQSPSAKAK